VNMPGLLEIVLWMFGAVVKFIVTPSLMVARGWGFWPTVIITSAGATAGVWVFFYFGKWILRKWAEFRGKKEPKRPFFTPQRRRVVRLRRLFGMWGLLAVSGLISVPIASILAAKYYQRNERMPWILVLAFVAWTFILTALSFLFIDIG
jgi:membrane protein DedA with SNARE-associated domain